MAGPQGRKQFNEAADVKKNGIGRLVVGPGAFVEHNGEPSVVFHSKRFNAKGEIEPTVSVMSRKDMNAAIDKLKTDHLKHEFSDANRATIRESYTALNAVLRLGIDLPHRSDRDIENIPLPAALHMSAKPEAANHGIKGDPIGDIIRRVEREDAAKHGIKGDPIGDIIRRVEREDAANHGIKGNPVGAIIAHAGKEDAEAPKHASASKPIGAIGQFTQAAQAAAETARDVRNELRADADAAGNTARFPAITVYHAP